MVGKLILLVSCTFLTLTANGLEVMALQTTTDVGQGVFNEWFTFFHHEISIALSIVQKTNFSNSCKSNLTSYLHDLYEYKSWAVQMWDSMDALPAGILQGNFYFWPGSYDECVQVERSELKPQYCLTNIQLKDEKDEIAKLFPMTNSSIQIGICLPSRCTSQEINTFLNNFLWPNATVAVLSCQTTSRHLDSSVIAIIVILSIFAILIILGTFLELIPRIKKSINNEESEDLTNKKSEKLWMSGLVSFSLFSNAKALFATDQGGGIGSLHGLRFLSMAWIILLHTYSTSLPTTWNNIFAVSELRYNFLAEIILNGNIAVDTFYCMRLTPVYAIIIGIVAGLLPFFGSGPRWSEIEQMSHNCKENWWVNLLYVSNIFRLQTMCEPHCWFLSTDIQLYIVAPIILYPLYKNKFVGGAIATIITLSCVVADALVTYFYNLPGTSIIFTADSGEKQIEYSQKVYMQAYARGGPYVIGIITGYVLSKQYDAPKFLNKKIALVGWLAATVCNLTVLFGLFNYISNNTIPSLVERCLYSALTRTVWAAGIAWIVLACKWGYGGHVNSILSWNIFIPLGKLTYCAYILHYNMLIMFFTSRQSTLYYDHWIAIYIYLGILTSAYVLAVPFSLIFELPILKLEKLITVHQSNQLIKSVLTNNQKSYDSTSTLDNSNGTGERKGIANTAFEG